MMMLVPKSTADAETLLRRDCEIEAALQKIESKLNADITRARDAAREASFQLSREQAGIRTALKAWFRAWRKDNPGSVWKCIFGRVIARPKRAVRFAEGLDEEAAAAALINAGLSDFVRVKCELNRAAIHDAPEDVKEKIARCGVLFDPGENVSVEPDTDALCSSHADSGVLGGN